MPAAVLSMTKSNGVWHVRFDSSWTGKYYLFEATLYVRRTWWPTLTRLTWRWTAWRRRLTNLAEGRCEGETPQLDSFNDLTIYELHSRDFSAGDRAYRGTYLAFTNPESDGIYKPENIAKPTSSYW